jgi:hypothetical protein
MTIGFSIIPVASLESFLASLSAQDLRIYTPVTSLHQAIQDLGALLGKTIHPYPLGSIYPVRRVFALARQISQTRVNEIEALIPDFYQWGHTGISLKNLAIRRLSLSYMFHEVSLFLALYGQWQTEGKKGSLVFLTNAFTQADLVDYFSEPDAMDNVWILPMPVLQRRFKHSPTSPGTSATSIHKSLRVSWEHWKHKPFKAFKTTLKETTKHVRKTVKSRMQTFTRRTNMPLGGFKSTYKQFKTGVRQWPLAYAEVYQNLRRYFSPSDQRPLLIPIYALVDRVPYYLLLYRPLMANLIRQGITVHVMVLCEIDPDTLKHFQTRLAEGFPEKSIVFTVANWKKLPLIEAYHNKAMLPTDRHAEVQSALAQQQIPEHLRPLMEQAAYNYSALKRLALITFHSFKRSHFQAVMGIEEDIEIVSLLTLFRQVSPLDYQTWLIPSCLPEYSECYDCVDVDQFAVHDGFVQQIFEDQHFNTRRFHVVGTTEWEEPPPQEAALPQEAQRLVNASDFVLGVFHQPLFTSHHGTVLYDNLVVNFPDVYERFLGEHPDGCILIKPHKHDNLDYMARFLPDSDRILVLPKTLSNQLVYPIFDVALSIHSTTLLHSIAHGLPVIALYNYPDYQAYYDFIRRMGGLATNHHDEVLAYIRRLREDKVFRQEIHTKVEAFTEQHRQNPASRQLGQLIRHSLS